MQIEIIWEKSDRKQTLMTMRNNTFLHAWKKNQPTHTHTHFIIVILLNNYQWYKNFNKNTMKKIDSNREFHFHVSSFLSLVFESSKIIGIQKTGDTTDSSTNYSFYWEKYL